MRLTTKGRFAVAAMIDLAMQQGDAPVTLSRISQRQKISLSYLEQLFARLRRRALVISVRGPGGGYCLAKDVAQVSVADIIIAVDEPLGPTQGDGGEDSPEDPKCVTHDLWAGLDEHILHFLGAVTLRQLVDGQNAKVPGVAQVQDMRARAPKRDRTPLAA